MPRSGSLILGERQPLHLVIEALQTYLWIFTSSPNVTLFIACGVIRMNCRPTERLAVWIIICMLCARLTLSMKTSNSSKQRMGDPMASQMLSSKQIVEKDFSPPLRVLAWRPESETLVMSGSTEMSNVLSGWFSKTRPRYLRSERRYWKVMRARRDIWRLNWFQRKLRCRRVSCKVCVVLVNG